MLSLPELETAAAAADTRARKARAEAARLRREIERVSVARSIAAERLIGSAVLSWCRNDERARGTIVRYLRPFLAAADDRALLRGTSLDLDRESAEAVAIPSPVETEAGDARN